MLIDRSRLEYEMYNYKSNKLMASEIILNIIERTKISNIAKNITLSG